MQATLQITPHLTKFFNQDKDQDSQSSDPSTTSLRGSDSQISALIKTPKKLKT